MTDFRITKDGRVFLNDFEIPNCMGVDIKIEGGEDPEVVLRISCERVSIDGYALHSK